MWKLFLHLRFFDIQTIEDIFVELQQIIEALGSKMLNQMRNWQ